MKLTLFKKFKKSSPPVPSSIWRNPLHFIAFGFGAGALPVAPGTFGTLMALPFYLLLAPLPWLVYLVCIFLITLGSIWLCGRVEREMQIHDHPGMCIDEIVGYLITMIHVPSGAGWMALGFLLFRLFDIWKPWPIRQVDRQVQGGLGVILDDVVAGVYAFLVLQVIVFLSYYTIHAT